MTTSSGRTKLNRLVYGAGSGHLNENPSDQDDPYIDQIREQRWVLFKHEYCGPQEQRLDAFNRKFGYDQSS